MAQTGYSPILIYSSTTASQAPLAANLTNSTLGSELAINITDGKLFYKDNANAIQVIGWKVAPTTAGGTGLTSFTANQVFYASSTSAVGQSANFTFNGNALTVKNSSSGGQYQAALSLQSTSASYGAGIQFYDGTNDGYISWFGQSLYFALTGGATGAALTTNGWSVNNLIKASGTGTIGNSTIFTDFIAPNGRIGSINTSGSPASNLELATSTAGGVMTSAVRITFAQNVNVLTGNVVISTAGKGIDFTANSGNVLSQYVENTWTPTVTSGTGAITTYTVSTAAYTRVGRQVTINFRIVINTVGTASGAMIVTLPITSASNSAAIGRETATTGYIVMGQIFNGGTTVNCYDGRTANGNCFVGGNGLTVNVSATYFV